ncbi:50S ribosomal protein L9 [Lacticaseibacillus parakribbianus]|uniref:50S ribosomal protein L9 n=1 Tax=Lacticaseibacillus parakribbianus TaxID=2970927 RepID=UPI0021CB83BE|nr:50S ribosomal protein L9 [Lacticaseibacillus parakribbianus]
MKVIFTEDVRGKGKRGQVKEVPDGYAQNFLIKNGKAKAATAQAMSALRGQQKLEEKKDAAAKAAAVVVKTQLENDKTVVQIQSKAGADSRLFGSIPSKQIAQALEKQYQIKVDKRKMDLPEPIKALGYRNVKVSLYPGVDANIRVHITELK